MIYVTRPEVHLTMVTVELLAFDPYYRIGRGRGNRSQPHNLEPIDVYAETKQSLRTFRSLFRLYPHDFDELYNELSPT